jgi:CRISPR-associated endonuclease Cas2
MKKFCVSYDLKDADNDAYLDIKDMLKEMNGEKIQESVWILTLEDRYDCEKLENELTDYLKKGDKIFIARIGGNYVSITKRL